MFFKTSIWLKLSLINLCIVAFAGVILRYKIVYSLPFIDQKHLLHGHSHFAFAGWISLALMSFMIAYLQKQGVSNAYTSYRSLLITQVVSAYGMLISFPIQGYGLFSISFSTLSILVSYVFMVRYWRDLQNLKNKSLTHSWFKAALFFNSLSSLGAFSLAYMMANHIAHQNWYLSAVYFFLHFQYNGWFFFACMGLFSALCENLGITISKTKTIFLLFALACMPTYYLSALWMPMFTSVFVLVVLSASAQILGFYFLMKFIIKYKSIFLAKLPKVILIIFSISGLALCIKLSLQLGSTYPPLSQLAFGFRPIVIAYLHLVLLGIITTFILGYLLVTKNLICSKYSLLGLGMFLGGIIFNEIVLMTQGIAGIRYESLPFTNELLLLAACIMFCGTLLIAFGEYAKVRN